MRGKGEEQQSLPLIGAGDCSRCYPISAGLWDVMNGGRLPYCFSHGGQIIRTHCEANARFHYAARAAAGLSLRWFPWQPKGAASL